MKIEEKISELSEPFLKSINAYVVELKYVQSKNRKEIQLFIDTDNGVTIEQCAEINRKLRTELEKSNLFEDSFVILVSSPGLDKPLKLLRQYKRNIGRKFKLKYKHNESILELVGTLHSVENEIIVFSDTQNNRIEIPFKEIIECKEQLPW